MSFDSSFHFLAAIYLHDLSPYLVVLTLGKDKGDFPLAEWNEISGKCFSHTPLGPGDGFRSCDV